MKRGFFISGKFDQLRKSEQSSAIKHAFQEFVQQLCSHNDDDNDADDSNHQARRREEIRRIVRPIVCSEPLLMEMLPGLKQLLRSTVLDDCNKKSDGDGGRGDYHSEDTTTTKGHGVRRPSIDGRLSHGFCRLIRSICSPTRPLVLFLGMFVSLKISMASLSYSFHTFGNDSLTALFCSLLSLSLSLSLRHY
jgi:hypothetical protein